MSHQFSQRSLDRMKSLHPDIVQVMNLAISRSPVDFTVLEGLRTVERQKHLVATGASKTMNSRHLTGHAIDIAPLDSGVVSWDWPLYHKLAPVIKEAAEELGVDLEWGGDWTSFKDGPHWQLSWNSYNKTDMSPRARLVRADGSSAVPPSEPKPEKSPVRSTTLQAAAGTAVAGGTATVTALSKLDPMAQYIVLGCAAFGALCLLWIAKERIRKWANGDTK